MPSNLITNISAAVGAGASIDIIPPAGQEYLVTDFFSQHAFVANAPDLQVGIYDGANNCISLIDPTTDPGKRTRQYQFYITHDNYLRLTNTGAAGANLGFTGERVRSGLTRTDIVAIGAGLGVEIIPAAGETLLVTEIGVTTWTAGPADINPDVSVGLTDGTLINSIILDPTMVRGQDKQLQIYINMPIHLYVIDTSGGGNNFAYSARRVPVACRSAVLDVVGSATWDIRPAAGEEVVVTELAAETWAGAAPNGYPDIIVSLMVGANLSDITKAGAASLRWNSDCILKIDHDHWIRVTENSAANNEVGYSAYLQRGY